MATIIKHLRAQYYEPPMPVQGLRQYHRSEQEIAGLWGTETCHPPLFNIPKHAHDLASFYIVLEGSLTEFYDRNQRDLGTYSVMFTPPGEIHRNAFHDTGGRCFLVELTPGWTDRLAASGIKLDCSLDTNNGELTRLATRLYKEFRYVDKVSALSVEGLALEILAAFSRQSRHSLDSTATRTLSSLPMGKNFSLSLHARQMANPGRIPIFG